MPPSVPPGSHDARVAPTAPRVAVRRATPRDLDVVIQLRLALLREYPDHPIYGRLQPNASVRAREVFTAQLRSGMESIFLADLRVAQPFAGEALECVGILRCMETTGSPLLDPARYAYVSSVYVRPDARRQGVLRAMLRAADDWASARGLAEMRLHNVAGSASAEGAWSALGFQVVEQVRLRQMGTRDR